MRLPHAFLFFLLASTMLLGGCRYYGSAVPPEYPLSMDGALDVANNQRGAAGGMQKPVIRQPTRPRVERPSYLPEKELALVKVTVGHESRTEILQLVSHFKAQTVDFTDSSLVISVSDGNFCFVPRVALPP